MSAEVGSVKPNPYIFDIEKRRKNKPRLAHDLGAGAKCNKCGDKCPGFELHFWRKICMNCRCGKDDHDVQDDDEDIGKVVIGKLFERPQRTKKEELEFSYGNDLEMINEETGRPEKLKFDWVPPNIGRNLAARYMALLPPDKRPVAGSEAAKERKKQLEQQVPLYDMDANQRCENMPAEELQSFETYMERIRTHVAGQGIVQEIAGVTRASVAEPLRTKNKDPQSGTSEEGNVGVMQGGIDDTYAVPYRQVTEQPYKHAQGGITSGRKEFMGGMVTEPGRFVASSNSYGVTPGTSHPLRRLGQDQGVKGITGQLSELTASPNQQVVSSQSGPHQHTTPQTANVLSPFISPDHRQKSTVPPSTPTKRGVNTPYGDHLTGRPTQLPYKEGLVPSKEGVVPSKEGVIPYKEGVVPSKEGLTPYKEGFVPSKEGVTPYKEGFVPSKEGVTPYKEGFIPSKEGVIPYKEGIVPSKEGVIPYKEGFVPSKEGVTPYKEGFVPSNQGVPTDQRGFIPGKPSLPGLTPDTQVPGQESRIADKQNPGQRSLVSGTPGTLSNFGSPAQRTPLITSLDQTSLTPIRDNMMYHYQTGDSQPSSVRPHEGVVGPYKPGGLGGIGGKEAGTGHLPQMPHREGGVIANKEVVQAPYVAYQETLAGGTQQMAPGSDVTVLFPGESLVLGSRDASEELPEQKSKFSCQYCGLAMNVGDVAIFCERAGTDKCWHPACFSCYTCKELLADLIYFYKDGKVYCGRHFTEASDMPRCKACDELIFGSSWTRADDSNWHIHHYCCYVCDTQLAGQRYVPDKEGFPYCLPCHMAYQAKMCQTCEVKIAPDENGCSHRGYHFHVSPHCFQCYSCKLPLLGKRFKMSKNWLFCSNECVQAAAEDLYNNPNPRELPP